MSNSVTPEKLAEIVENSLRICPCMTTAQMSTFIYRRHGFVFSKGRLAAALRSKSLKDKVVYSDCGYGAKVYWLKDEVK